MHIKQKIIKDRVTEGSKHRYGPTVKESESNTSLINSLTAQNKENDLNMRNRVAMGDRDTKKAPFDMLRSMQAPKRLRTSANQDEVKLMRKGNRVESTSNLLLSQELFKFKNKGKVEKYESANFGQHITFGEVNKRQMLTSREFHQDKQLKNEVIDELISNARRELCKSFNQFSNSSVGNCVNHPNKKAKYRLISELGEGQQQMFYCSKCAINLLQQGFRIQQIKPQQCDSQHRGILRGQQITKLQLKLKSIDERARAQTQNNIFKEDIEIMQEEIFNCNKKFGEIFQCLEEMRSQRVAYLHQQYSKLEKEKQARKEVLDRTTINIGDIQSQIQQYKQSKKFIVMKQNEFQFIYDTLMNKIQMFEQTLNQSQNMTLKQPPVMLQKTSTMTILQRLKTTLIETAEHPKTRRQREITFQRRNQTQSIQQQFGCDELKKPFRILFPADDSEILNGQTQPQKRSMLNSVRQCPTFGHYP